MATSVFAGSAGAAVVHPSLGTFGPEGTSGTGSFGNIGGVGVDEASGSVYVYGLDSGGKVFKFDSAGEPAAFSELGTPVIESVTPTLGAPGEDEVAVAPAASPGGTSGDIYVTTGTAVAVYGPGGGILGELASGLGEVCGVATDPAGHVFVGVFPSTIKEYAPSANPSEATEIATSVAELGGICNVAVDGLENVYPTRPSFSGSGVFKLEGLGAANPVSVDPDAWTLAVDPVSSDLYADRGDEVAQYDAAGNLLGTFGGEELLDSSGVGVDGQTGDVYASTGSGGRVAMFGPGVTTADVSVTAASEVGATRATVNGTVNPHGSALTACRFEYGTTLSYGQGEPCAGTVPSDGNPHPVSAVINGLAKDQTYHYRVSATNGSGVAVRSEDQTFTTLGPPLITEELPLRVEGEKAVLRALVDPAGFGTTYRFEWGTTTSYGHLVPLEFEPSLGAGTTPVPVSAELTGLAQATEYHFRVVAVSSSGTTFGADQPFETLDPCGLPAKRCLEQVSPPDKGEGAVQVLDPGLNQLITQASESGDQMFYPILLGLPGATAGGEVRYLASREDGSWISSQISTPSLVPGSSPSLATPSRILYASPSLSCSIVETTNPVAPTPALDRELEVRNIYMRDATGNYRLISALVPSNPELETGTGFEYFTIAGASPDCDRVYFSSRYELIKAGSGLYEWHDGTLTDAGKLPDGTSATGSGEVGPGGETANVLATRYGSVDEEGSQFVFSAPSDEGGDDGHRAVFVRAGAGTVSDASQSQTLVPDLGARYELASADGSQVLFAANYGLTPETSSGPQEGGCATSAGSIAPQACDLYDYDVASGHLTDLSADPNPADPSGASVDGVVSVSGDGSYVYFAARGQLIPHAGSTFAENLAGETTNMYEYHRGRLSVVATLTAKAVATESDLSTGQRTGSNGRTNYGVLARVAGSWNAQISASGTRLLFVSTRDLTGYESQGVPEAYLFDAGSDGLTCVSCRRDGQPSITAPELSPVYGDSGVTSDSIHYARSLSADGTRVFFTSQDPLAPGARAGLNNVFEWHAGQVSVLLPGLPGERAVSVTEKGFLDASADGSDVFVSTPEALLPTDDDAAPDLYDARVGAPPAGQGGGAPQPCDVLREGSCSAPSGAAPSAGPAPETSRFSGPPNPEAGNRHHRCSKNKRKKCKGRPKHRRHRRLHRGKPGHPKTGRTSK